MEVNYTLLKSNSAACGRTEPRGGMMKSFATKLRAFLVSEDGPTAVEYAVMLSLIVCVCLAAITTIGTNASSVFSKISNSI
jgi:pilus assembly protein Flp/PilA